MSKTPYEIRFDLLNLANTILSNRAIDKMHMPKSEEIMKEAQKLNMFVTDSCCICKNCDCNPCECNDGDCGC